MLTLIIDGKLLKSYSYYGPYHLGDQFCDHLIQKQKEKQGGRGEEEGGGVEEGGRREEGREERRKERRERICLFVDYYRVNKITFNLITSIDLSIACVDNYLPDKY